MPNASTPSGAVQVFRSGASVAPYRAVLEVLRSAIASGRGRLACASRTMARNFSMLPRARALSPPR